MALLSLYGTKSCVAGSANDACQKSQQVLTWYVFTEPVEMDLTRRQIAVQVTRVSCPAEEESQEAAKASEAALVAATGVQAWEHGLYFDAGGGDTEQKKSRKRSGGSESVMDDEDNDEGPSKPAAKAKAKKTNAKATGPQDPKKGDDGKKKPGKRK